MQEENTTPASARTGTTSQTQTQLQHHTRLAVVLTQGTGTMWTAYVFTVLAIIGLFGLLGWLNPFVFLLTTWISQQFSQLGAVC